MSLRTTLTGLAVAAAFGSVLLLGAPQKAEAGVHLHFGAPGIYFGGYPSYYGYPRYHGGYGYYPRYRYNHYPRYKYHRYNRYHGYKHHRKRYKYRGY